MFKITPPIGENVANGNIYNAIKVYIQDLNRQFQTGITTEHSFRPALKQLIEDCTKLKVVNEQSHIDCGAPDMTVLRQNLAVAYIEAKDLEDGDLDGRKKNKEQFDRYKLSLDTIIFTDYLDFHLYEHGEWKKSARLAEIQGNKIRPSDIDGFIALIEHVRDAKIQSITSASKLAQIMAGKARLLRDIIEQALIQYGDNPTELRCYMEDFRKTLLHDITPKKFADIYAQTIAYGMFAARLHDDTPQNFTREEASKLIPKSNPFLRKIFQKIAGFDLDDRIAWIVDDLVAAFAATDMQKIMQGFGKSTQQTDPILHFYEDFLFQYDPAAKKQSGVYYTPQPVVEFIVRAVDDILRTEFDLPMGLADTTKAEVEQEIPQDPKHRKEKKMLHRVQILDPATGTGTFLAETVKQIKRDLGGQMGAWNSYVPEHLRPRLYGFELMMAPYTIAHIKLDNEIGVKMEDRLNVYLTNSLEEANVDSGTLFGDYLAQEANAASNIKKERPVMIVMGNPPYSVSSNNKGGWINSLLDDYKKNLNERNIQPLSDDYIKFIRLAQYYVERNGEGVLAYICNNSFIDGLIHRQMRSELMRVFDKIYILDLHGNTRKKEIAPDGSKDENVFDIMQGVSINIFIKKSGKSKVPAEVRHFDLYGLREYKYEYLRTHSLASVNWSILNPQEPQLFFVPKDFGAIEEYENGFKIDELCSKGTMGIATGNDDELVSLDVSTTRDGYLLSKPYYFRPFDIRYTIFDNTVLQRARYKIMSNYNHKNLGLNVVKQSRGKGIETLVSENISCRHLVTDLTFNFPLYLYPEPGSIETERRPNLDDKIWTAINTAVGHETTPEDIFDYIYGVLHSPAYREKYKEFLKVDFPRIPYPKNADEFEHFRACGNELRELHLMHSVPKSEVTFDVIGDNKVEFIRPVPNFDDGYSNSIYINDTQYFAPVPTEAWNMYIGGYQPAQKWLKDRKDRVLTYDDITHYEQIIQVLMETARIMKSIDDPTAQLEEYKRKVHDLEKQLAAQHRNDIHYHIDHVDTLNLGDNVENKFS